MQDDGRVGLRCSTRLLVPVLRAEGLKKKRALEAFITWLTPQAAFPNQSAFSMDEGCSLALQTTRFSSFVQKQTDLASPDDGIPSVPLVRRQSRGVGFFC